MKIIIGIDPDLEKSGVAIYREDKSLELMCLSFFDVLKVFDEHGPNIQKVVIEAGWLNRKSNFHCAKNQQIGERIAKNVGENHAVGKLLIEACAIRLIETQLLRPTDTKKNAEEFARITGYQGSTNPEKRDAGMLVYGMPFKNTVVAG